MVRPILIAVLFLGFFIPATAQDAFEDRLKIIQDRLQYFSDSIVPGLNETVNFAVVDTPIQELLRGMAETHNLNVSINPGISIRVTNNFTNARVMDVILFLCREYKFDITFVNSIMSFYAYAPPEPEPLPYKQKKIDITYNTNTDRLTVDLNQDSISVFARQITKETNKNVILYPGAGDRLLNGYIKDMPFEQALEKIAFSNNLALKKSDDGFFILQPSEIVETIDSEGPRRNQPTNQSRSKRNNITPSTASEIYIETKPTATDTLISVDAVNAPIAEIIKQASFQLNKNYILFSEPAGNTTTNVKDITYEELLSYLLQTSTHTYQRNFGVYLIGERNQEGFRNTEVLKLQFRTVDKILEAIPAEMAKGVEIKVFPELNSLILSGGRPQINEIKLFLNAIDKPVPNILIEVIVADVRKGTSLRTGIQAFLSDSVPNTSGQIFPGMDVTLSSKSINNVLEKLNETGIVNLGKVTPKFYATLEAMEQNNNMNLRSTPKLSTLNGHEANLTIGQSVYYLEETQNISGGVSPITTVSRNFKKVEANLSIKILPIVSGNDHITLTIAAEFSDFIAPQIDGAPPGNATRNFTSQIRIRNEEMIVLGGLEEVRKQKNRSGFPILSRIPILNFLFSARSDEKTDNQLIVFIKPTLVY